MQCQLKCPSQYPEAHIFKLFLLLTSQRSTIHGTSLQVRSSTSGIISIIAWKMYRFSETAGYKSNWLLRPAVIICNMFFCLQVLLTECNIWFFKIFFVTGACSSLPTEAVGERRQGYRKKKGLKCVRLLHMTLFKRCNMGKEVCLQRNWRWERPLHPDPAKCGGTSVKYAGLLFGMSWFCPPIDTKTEGRGLKRSRGLCLAVWAILVVNLRLDIILKTFF